MSDISKKVDSIEKLAKEAERLAKSLQGNPFLVVDRIANDIEEQKENAMAMEFTKCIGELLRKNGVVPKMTEYTAEFDRGNTFEHRYGVSIDKLDFSEHDKVFENKIASLEKQIERLMGSNNMADVRKMKMDIVEKSEEIAKALSQGKDIVITKSPTGIVVKKMTVQKI